MTKKKAVFFDIDGTLWDVENHIPPSTIEAIQNLRKNGNLAFLCTGRSRAYVQDPGLLGIGFDGIVSGCGTMIEYEGETVFYHRIEPELAVFTVDTVRQHGFRPILEGKEYIYMEEREFVDNFYGKKLKAELGDRLLPIDEKWGEWEISKLSCATENCDQQSCFAALERYYDYMVHNSEVVEIVPKGFHKGTGIAKVCEMLGIGIADTFAFGDSANDIGMLQDAGCGIVMGDGSTEAKEAADYVTSPMMEDGIWNACRHFQLI